MRRLRHSSWMYKYSNILDRRRYGKCPPFKLFTIPKPLVVMTTSIVSGFCHQVAIRYESVIKPNLCFGSFKLCLISENRSHVFDKFTSLKGETKLKCHAPASHHRTMASLYTSFLVKNSISINAHPGCIKISRVVTHVQMYDYTG